MINGTETPTFQPPDYSYRYEELTEDQKKTLYKRTYMEKLTKRQILRITGIGFLSFLFLVSVGSFFVRLIVELIVWSYNGFGLW